MKYLKSRIQKCFCNKMSKGTNKLRLAKYMPISSNNSNIQYFHVQKSRCTSFLHKREELGNEVVISVASANYYNRLWLI
jgi:hypothetical protein